MPMLKMSILPIALLATLPAAAVYSVADGTDGELPVIFAIRKQFPDRRFLLPVMPWEVMNRRQDYGF